MIEIFVFFISSTCILNYENLVYKAHVHDRCGVHTKIKRMKICTGWLCTKITTNENYPMYGIGGGNIGLG